METFSFNQEVPGVPEKSRVKRPDDIAKPGRRNFLKGLLGVGALAAVAGQPILELVEETTRPEQLEEELRQYEKRLQDEYGVGLDFSLIPEARGSSVNLSLAERCDFAKSILEAIEVYPKSYIVSSGIKTVQGVKEVVLKKQMDPMDTTTGYFVKNGSGRLVISKEDFVNYVTADTFGWRNSERVKAIFHHEFYHQNDPNGFNRSYNEKWNRESSEKGAVPREVSFLDPFSIRKEGFTSTYGALNGGNEDRAEVSMSLFLDPVGVEKLAGKEPALFDKVEKIKKEFFNRTHGIIDETYWKLRKEGNIQAVKNYLETRDKLA